MIELKNASVSVPFWGLAGASWLATFALILVGWLVGSLYLAALGLAMSAVGATLTIRCYLCRLNDHIRTAYEMGQHSLRGVSSRRVP